MASISGTSDSDALIGTSESDEITGGAGADNINAGDGNDTVAGGAGQDSIDLGAGDDTWLIKDDEVVLNSAYGWWGASAIFDSAVGGEGSDTIWIQTSSQNTRVDLSNATIMGFETLLIANPDDGNYRRTLRLNDAQIGQLDSIEGRYAYYSSWNDSLSIYQSNIDGQFAEMVITGNLGWTNDPQLYLTDDGDDLITFNAASIGTFNVNRLFTEAKTVFINADGDLYITASEFDDSLTGGAGIDIFDGSAGDDSIFGNAGNDVLYGGTGNDNITGGTISLEKPQSMD